MSFGPYGPMFLFYGTIHTLNETDNQRKINAVFTFKFTIAPCERNLSINSMNECIVVDSREDTHE